jgi:hypothetical protein
MRLKNFSQLPVIDGTSDLAGVLTWTSIATCYEKKKDLTLANAMIRDDLPVAEVHQEVFAYSRRSATTATFWSAATAESSSESSPAPTSPTASIPWPNRSSFSARSSSAYIAVSARS